MILTPGDQHAREHHDAGQQDQRRADAIHAEVQADAERRQPVVLLDELITGQVLRQVLDVDRQRKRQVQDRGRQRDRPDQILLLRRHQQNDQAGRDRGKDDDTQERKTHPSTS